MPKPKQPKINATLAVPGLRIELDGHWLGVYVRLDLLSDHANPELAALGWKYASLILPEQPAALLDLINALSQTYNRLVDTLNYSANQITPTKPLRPTPKTLSRA